MSKVDAALAAARIDDRAVSRLLERAKVISGIEGLDAALACDEPVIARTVLALERDGRPVTVRAINEFGGMIQKLDRLRAQVADIQGMLSRVDARAPEVKEVAEEFSALLPWASGLLERADRLIPSA